ncbi:MAG: Na/Pi cotransporter family protein [Alphaproteobacteria bacterium]
MNINTDYFFLWSGLLGGLALFLLGMDILTKSLKIVTGSRMKDLLALLSKNRLSGIFTGILITSLVNSSSVTIAIVVSFVSAGLISMMQCIGIIMGANIGSTIATQILAFDVIKIALPIVTIGFVISFFGRKEKLKEYGNILLGFGLIFYGVYLMKQTIITSGDNNAFISFIKNINNSFYAILIGAVFTSIIQYSVATMGLVLVLAGQGFLSLPIAIAICFGANIGTCITALFNIIGKNRESLRTALFHVTFNVVGVLIWVWFIPEIAKLVIAISPKADPNLSQDLSVMPRQIANAHTMFNVLNTMLFIWFIPQITKFFEKLIPEVPEEKQEKIKPLFISDELLDIPEMALSRCRMEIGELGRSVLEMYDKIMKSVISGNKDELDSIVKMDERVDMRHGFIIDFLSKLVKKSDYDEYQTDEIMELIQITNHFENMGDLIETGLVTIGKRRIAEKVVVSRETREMLEKYQQQIMIALEKIILAVRDRNMSVAKEVYEMKKGMSRLTLRVSRHQALRLVASEPNRLQTYTREMEMIENFSQIFKLCRRIAKAMFNSRDIYEKIASENEERTSRDFEAQIIEDDYSV